MRRLMILFSLVFSIILVAPSFAYALPAATISYASAEIVEFEAASEPVLTASLSESASALNFGETVNFTVTADGGTKPYTYAFYIDGQLVQNSSSPTYSTDTQPVGSHHVHVQVTDAEHNSANTLTVEFNILPTSSSSPRSTALSPSPSIPEFPSTTFLWVIAAAALLGTLMLKRRANP